MKDLILKRDEARGKKATMHIVANGDGFAVINDILGGRIVFRGKSQEECEMWFFENHMNGATQVVY